ncbi:MAG: SPOR domain-containing protein [Micromonosporaceae bacterium]
MPVRADGVIVQIFIAFVMIGALGLVLRWTFGGPRRSSLRGTGEPAATSTGEPAPPDVTAPLEPRPVDGPMPPPGEVPVSVASPAGTAVAEDFGLLTPVVTVETAAMADRVRARLRAAGIRATTSRGQDGRYRVLVFSSDLRRARRIEGSPC